MPRIIDNERLVTNIYFSLNNNGAMSSSELAKRAKITSNKKIEEVCKIMRQTLIIGEMLTDKSHPDLLIPRIITKSHKPSTIELETLKLAMQREFGVDAKSVREILKEIRDEEEEDFLSILVAEDIKDIYKKLKDKLHEKECSD